MASRPPGGLVLHDDTAILPLAPGPLVLVVDDETGPRNAVTRMLRGLDHQARHCSGGRAALRFLRDHPREVRLLVTDLGMPDMDGGELAERARDLDPSLGVVLLADPDDARAQELLGGYRDLPILWKPVGVRELAWKVEEFLRTPGRSLGHPLASAPVRTRARLRTSGRHEV